MWTALALLLAVGAGPPDWEAPLDGAFPDAMSVTAVVEVGGVALRSSSDRVAAFVGGEVRGVAAPTLVGSRRVFFLSVAGDEAVEGTVTFQAYDAAADRVVELTPDLAFDPATPVGTAATPFVWRPAFGEPPVWTVDPADFDGSMIVAATVRDGAGLPVTEAGTLVGAFVDGERRGAAEVLDTALGPLAFVQVYGADAESAEVTFRVYRPGPGRVFEVPDRVALDVGGSAGTPASPVVLTLLEGQTLTGAEGWRMLASPEATSVGAFLEPFWTQGFVGADHPGGECTVFVFDETVGTFEGGWTCIDQASRPLGPGDGVMVYVFEDDDFAAPDVQGGFPKELPRPAAPAAAPFSAFGLTFSGDVVSPAASEGWSLGGNPLGAAFDWDGVEVMGGLTETVYVYDPAYLGGDYRTWTRGLGGELPDGVVPQNQGFFVRADAAAPTLTVPEAAVVGAGPDVFGRSAQPDPLRLSLAVVEGDETDREVSVAFVAPHPDAALDLDAFDAVRLAPTAWPRAVLSTTTPAGDALTLNAVPEGHSAVVELPLAVELAGWPAGALALVLRWSGSLPAGWSAALVDRETDTTTPLSVDGRLAFTLDMAAGRAGGSGARGLRGPHGLLASAPDPGVSTGDRFALRLTPPGAVATDVAWPVAVRLDAPFPNPARGRVRLAYGLAETGAVRLSVHDALGRTVAVLHDGPATAGAHALEFDAQVLAPGSYLVRLLTPAGTALRPLTVVR